MGGPGSGRTLGAVTVEFTDELAAEILRRIAEGESVRALSVDPRLPSRSSIKKRIREDVEFQKAYSEACEVRADHIFDEILEIIERRDPIIIGITEDGCPDALWPDTKEEIARDRLRVDARKWMLGKMNPSKYGERLDLSATGNVPFVILAPTPVEDADEWATQYDKTK